MNLTLRTANYMSRYAPSRVRIMEYLRKKKCQDIEGFLTEIAYDEDLMLSMWMRTFLSLGKGKREIELKLLKKGFTRENIRKYLLDNTEELEDWESQRSSILRQIDTLIVRGKSLRMIAALIVPKYPYFRDQIDAILESMTDTNSLEKEMQKYQNRYNIHDMKQREKLIAALMRKGFAYASIREQLTIHHS